MNTQLSFADIQEITTLKSRYFRAVDTHTWELLRDVFTPNAEFMGYGFGIRRGTDTLISVLSEVLAPVSSQHLGANPEIRAIPGTGDTPQHAVALWTFRDELHWDLSATKLNAPGVRNQIGVQGGGYYQDDLVRTPFGWRISRSRNSRTHLSAVTTSGTVALPVTVRALDPHWLDPHHFDSRQTPNNS